MHTQVWLDGFSQAALAMAAVYFFFPSFSLFPPFGFSLFVYIVRDGSRPWFDSPFFRRLRARQLSLVFRPRKFFRFSSPFPYTSTWTICRLSPSSSKLYRLLSRWLPKICVIILEGSWRVCAFTIQNLHRRVNERVEYCYSQGEKLKPGPAFHDRR